MSGSDLTNVLCVIVFISGILAMVAMIYISYKFEGGGRVPKVKK